MKIGILGSGIVGQTLGAGFLKYEHQVMLGTRDVDKPDVQSWLREHPAARCGSFADAAEFGELIVLATAGKVAASALELAGADKLKGKTVMDVTNPIADAPPVNGVLSYFTGINDSLGEQLQAKFSGAHIVKAFNSVGAGRMVNPTYAMGPPTMFLAGDDAQAKAQVEEIARQFGWEPMDMGGIIASRALEPLCILWCIPVFSKGQATHAFKLLNA